MRLPRTWLLEFLQADQTDGHRSACTAEQLYPLFTMGIAEVDSMEEMEGDTVFHLTQKPDRGDCLSVEGLALEVAALAEIPFREPDGVVIASAPSSHPDPAPIPIRIDDPGRCGRYVGCVLEGVNVGPSPEWLQQRLAQIGIRSINNVVDVTALVMFELGQPLHAFDLDTIRGPEVIIRTATIGESIVAINGASYTLSPEMLVIADADRPIAIAGVMGGQETEVTRNTTRILVESAWFDPVSVRLTSRALGLSTDASIRFERAVDPAGCLRAARRAVQWIVELAGGQVVGGYTDVAPRRFQPWTVKFRPARARRLLGMNLSDREIRESLERLGLGVQGHGEEWSVTVPTRRPDLTIEEDLVEEVVRIVGYDRVPSTLPVGASTPGEILPERAMVDRMKDALVGAGYLEVRSYSLTHPDALQRAGGLHADRVAGIRNASSLDRVILRPTILPQILETAAENLGHGFQNQYLFEIGRVFLQQAGASRPEETTHLAGIAIGTAWTSGWNLPENLVSADFFSVKGTIEALAAALRLRFSFSASSDHPAMHPGRTARVTLEDGAALGWIGEIHPAIAARYDLTARPILFEIAVDPLLPAHLAQINRPLETDIVRQPPATRDLAVVVKNDVPYAEVLGTIRGVSDLVCSARLFDLYRGPGIAADEKSLAFALALQAPGRTLTDGEANRVMDEIVAALTARFGARRR